MNAVQALYDSLSPRDAILLAATPTLMAPRFGRLDELAVGGRRYVAARDGWYLEARSPVVSACVRLAQAPRPLPYGTVEPYVHLAGGLLPRELLFEFLAEACAAAPQEWAAGVVYSPANHRYERVGLEVVSASDGHITYRMPDDDSDRLVLDIHSHGHGPAFFSRVDDASDLHGVYIASVLGHCTCPEAVQCVSRLVIDGYTFDLDWHPFA